MNYTHEVGEKSTVKLTITFTGEEWKDAISKAYLKERTRYTVPGFRKGKAPKSVLENYYGKGVFYEEALNCLYNDHYYEILQKEKENFTAVGEPSLSVKEINDEGGVTLEAIVPVKPEVTIDQYTGLKIKKFEYNVSDGEVEQQMKRICEKDVKEVEAEGRPAQKGDKVVIDFSGSVDGEQFAGGTAEDYSLVLGSGTFIPGFEEQVEGMEIGVDRDIKVTFPEDYSSETLRGKEAVFAIKLHKIIEMQYPELTDEYVKTHANCATVDEYRAKTRERLENNAKNRSRDDTENSIMSEIVKHTHAEVPQAMIEKEIDGMVKNFEQRLAMQGITLEEYLKYTGQEIAAFRAQFNEQAQSRVMTQLAIDKILRTEKITLEEGELDKKIEEQAQSIGKTLEEYKKTIDPRQVEYITNDIIITKLFDFLMKNNDLYTE